MKRFLAVLAAAALTLSLAACTTTTATPAADPTTAPAETTPAPEAAADPEITPVPEATAAPAEDTPAPAAEDNRTPEEILADITEAYQAAVQRLKDGADQVYATVDPTYDAVAANQSVFTDYYDQVRQERDDLYAMVIRETVAYFRAVTAQGGDADALENAAADYYSVAIENCAQAFQTDIGDGVLQEMQDVYMEQALDDEEDAATRQEWLDVKSEYGDNFAEIESDLISGNEEFSETMVELYWDIFARFHKGDTEIEDLLASLEQSEQQ